MCVLSVLIKRPGALALDINNNRVKEADSACRMADGARYAATQYRSLVIFFHYQSCIGGKIRKIVLLVPGFESRQLNLSSVSPVSRRHAAEVQKLCFCGSTIQSPICSGATRTPPAILRSWAHGRRSSSPQTEWKQPTDIVDGIPSGCFHYQESTKFRQTQLHLWPTHVYLGFLARRE